MSAIHLLDYGGGNVRSITNAIEKLGYQVSVVKTPQDISSAQVGFSHTSPSVGLSANDLYWPVLQKLVFPGVGAFGSAMTALESRGFKAPLREYIASGKPFLGICIGLQCLFDGSDESQGVQGLSVIRGSVRCFDSTRKSVPHMGWNGVVLTRSFGSKSSTSVPTFGIDPERVYYFVHSYAAPFDEGNKDIGEWALGVSRYGEEEFVSVVQRGNVIATQFHPEKSGYTGLRFLRAFLSQRDMDGVAWRELLVQQQQPVQVADGWQSRLTSHDRFTKRIVACLDVRTNDQGDLVVTKGDQYDVRENEVHAKSDSSGSPLAADGSTFRPVRNLGKPVDLARRYFEEGADEIVFLNITSFRDCPLHDLPMLHVLQQVSRSVFVPLTIGGGIRDMVLLSDDGSQHVHVSALEIVDEYFRSGADKVSIGSDAVYTAEEFHKRVANGEANPTGLGKDGQLSPIEAIAKAYGSQAVVISVDPQRVYVADPSHTAHHTIQTTVPGPKGEQHCWFQCAVRGGRETRDLDVVQLVTACEKLGAGEILLNSIDHDGSNAGYDLELVQMVRQAVRIPVVASSGAGNPQHFEDALVGAGADAALAAGIFHRQEVAIGDVKAHLVNRHINTRPLEQPL